MISDEELLSRLRRIEQNQDQILTLLRTLQHRQQSGGQPPAGPVPSRPPMERFVDGRREVWGGEGTGWVPDWTFRPKRSKGTP